MCCGRNRMQQRIGNPGQTRPKSHPAGRQGQRTLSFVNLGSAITLHGPVSGTEYRFGHAGARIEVDPRDRVLLASIRQLRQMS